MISEITGRLEYIRPSVHSLICSLANERRFENLGFLRQAADRMQAGIPFPESWRDSLAESKAILGREETAILTSLGDVLGRSNLESQLSALKLAGIQLEQRMSVQRERVNTHSGLYRSMGVLGGVAAAIMLI